MTKTPATYTKTPAPFKELPIMDMWTIDAMEPDSDKNREIYLTFDEYAALLVELGRLRGTTAAKLVAAADKEVREEGGNKVPVKRTARAAQSVS